MKSEEQVGLLGLIRNYKLSVSMSNGGVTSYRILHIGLNIHRQR